jgi:hypothetical protein
MGDCTALVVVEQPTLPVEFTEELQLASNFARASKAEATRAPIAPISGSSSHGAVSGN